MESPLIQPWDAHNQALAGNVHPPDWMNPKPAGRYNMVVIGAGSAGLITAAGTAGLGGKVALIERHLMGGDCLNVGCVPSKGLIRAARAAADVREAGQFGVNVPDGVTVDFPAVMERMRRLRAGISPVDSAARFRDLGVDVFIGEGRFTGPDTVEVGGQTLSFAKATIATGARAAVPSIPGLSEAGFLTNETVFSLTKLPRRLAVIGAGPIGCELAQAFRRFGSEVCMLESACQILTREDRDAASIVQAAFEREGIQLVCNARIQKVTSRRKQRIVHLEGPDGPRELVVDQILSGVGRTPNVEGLGLEAAGVEYTKRGVSVSDMLQTSNPNIYAAGDICNAFKFTHMADATARIVIQNALFGGRKKASALVVPWCTYTDPEMAHVGLYEHQANEAGIEVETFVQKFDEVDRAILDGESQGMVKVLVKKGTDRILGGTIVARHAGEMISELTLAITAGIGMGKISEVIHPYPTQAEAIRRTADAYKRTKLTPFVKNLFDRWLTWRRG